jgi:hypothetical protein
VSPGAELLDRSFLQMKLTDLPGSAAPSTPADAAPGAQGADAAPTTSADPAEAPADAAPAAAQQAGEGA